MGFSIQTDHVIEARRLDLIAVDKKERSCNNRFCNSLRCAIEDKEKDR